MATVASTILQNIFFFSLSRDIAAYWYGEKIINARKKDLFENIFFFLNLLFVTIDWKNNDSWFHMIHLKVSGVHHIYSYTIKHIKILLLAFNFSQKNLSPLMESFVIFCFLV